MISTFTVMFLLSITVISFTIIGIVYSSGRLGSTDDFLTARGSTGRGILSATFLASFLGVFILFTPPEAGSIGGITTIIGYGIGVASLYIAFLVIGPKIKSYLPEGSTLNDFAQKRYGAKMHLLTVLLSLFYMFVHLVAELTAIGLVAYQLSGVPLFYTAMLIGLGTLIYTAYGGLRASMFTDMIQMVLIGVLLIVVVWGVGYYGGGYGEIIRQTRLNAPDLLNFKNIGGIEYGLTLCIAVFASNLFHQGYWQRVYAGKDNATLRKSLITCILLVLPIMFVSGFLGIVSTGMEVSESPSVALFSLVYELFPNGLILGVFILALVLVMSTVDTLLNATVATITIDSQKLFKNIKMESPLKFARIITVLLMIPAVLIASKGFSVLYLFFVADLICVGVFFPLFYGLFNPKLTEEVALLAAVLGVVSGIPFFIADKLLIAFSLPVLVSVFICVIGNIANNKRLTGIMSNNIKQSGNMSRRDF